jgi:fibronectin type 3 domain-containing protein
LTATISPSNATNKNVSWSSSNAAIASVTGGTVTGVAAGTATITVTTADSNRTATCSVTVTTSGGSTAVSKPDIPTGVDAAAVSPGNIVVTWFSVTGATGYKVYRSTSANGPYSNVGDVTTTSFTNSGITTTTSIIYFYKVSAYNSAGESSQSSYASAQSNVGLPTIPKNVVATATSTTSITVSWTAVINATGYWVSRATRLSSNTYRFVGDVTTNSFIDTELISGETYHYKVSAYSSLGNSADSSYASATTFTLVSIPTMPSGVSATAASSNSITVNWSTVAGATGYKVYRSASSSSSYSNVGDVTTVSFTDTELTASTTYYYKVTAYNSAGESSQSSYASATTSTLVSIPTTPSGVSVTSASSNSITVSWIAVTGASSYKVYRSATSSGSYTSVGDVTATSYTDTGLSGSTTYYYKVSAYNSAGESSQSSPISATTSATVKVPSAPIDLKATAESSSSITLTWREKIEASGYKVHRRLNRYSGLWTIVGDVTSPSFTDTGLSKSTTYYYEVSAYNSAGESSWSITVEVKTLYYDPSTSIPDTPTNLVLVGYSSSFIQISWDQVNGAIGYKVYRSTSSTGTYSLLRDVKGDWDIVDNGLPANTIYYYKVSAYNSIGESPQSSALSAKTYY